MSQVLDSVAWKDFLPPQRLCSSCCPPANAAKYTSTYASQEQFFLTSSLLEANLTDKILPAQAPLWSNGAPQIIFAFENCSRTHLVSKFVGSCFEDSFLHKASLYSLDVSVHIFTKDTNSSFTYRMPRSPLEWTYVGLAKRHPAGCGKTIVSFIFYDCQPAMKYAVEVVLAIHAVVLPSLAQQELSQSTVSLVLTVKASSSSHNGEGTGCGNGYHLCWCKAHGNPHGQSNATTWTRSQMLERENPARPRAWWDMAECLIHQVVFLSGVISNLWSEPLRQEHVLVLQTPTPATRSRSLPKPKSSFWAASHGHLPLSLGHTKSILDGLDELDLPIQKQMLHKPYKTMKSLFLRTRWHVMTWKDMERHGAPVERLNNFIAARSHLTHGGPLDQSANVSMVAWGNTAHIAHGANNSKNFHNKKTTGGLKTCFQGDNLGIPAHCQLGSSSAPSVGPVSNDCCRSVLSIDWSSMSGTWVDVPCRKQWKWAASCAIYLPIQDTVSTSGACALASNVAVFSSKRSTENVQPENQLCYTLFFFCFVECIFLGNLRSTFCGLRPKRWWYWTSVLAGSHLPGNPAKLVSTEPMRNQCENAIVHFCWNAIYLS